MTGDELWALLQARKQPSTTEGGSSQEETPKFNLSSFLRGSSNKTSTPFDPFTNTNTKQPWEEQYSSVLSNPTLDPSTFRTQIGQDGAFQVFSGDQLVSSFQDQNLMKDFVSQYTQGWQQRQNSVSSQDAFRRKLEAGGWTMPTPTVQTNTMQEQEGQFIDPNTGQLGASPQVGLQQGQTSQAPLPEEIQTALMDAIKSSGSMEELLSTLGPIVGTLSGQSQVEAAQTEMARESTVQGQLEDLMKSFEDGNPPWATGPMRAANAIMAQRGLSASSMAGRAITNAVMEAAMPIAMADANMSAQFQFANLSNLQQARIQNAQSFLQMDLANFNAAQQMQMFKAQERSSALLSDVAQENAARQFNAANQNQTNQFMASLALLMCNSLMLNRLMLWSSSTLDSSILLNSLGHSLSLRESSSTLRTVLLLTKPMLVGDKSLPRSITLQ
jgi:hypothetical protein